MPKRSKPLSFVPDYDATPGENFKRLIEAQGIRDDAGVKALAKKMGVDPSVIADIANDTETITQSIADLLARGTGIKAAFWMEVVKRCNSKL